MPLRQIYGQTETARRLHASIAPGEVDFDTVGVPFGDDIELRIDEPDQNGVGEIVTRHPNMFAGYLGVEDVADMRDGWLHTGDAGYFDKRGQLVVIDRIKDIATTSGRRPLLARSSSRTS